MGRSALLAAALAWGRAFGSVRLVLHVGDHVPGAARLYRAAGFAETGVQGRFPPPREHLVERQFARTL
ncbi:MAG: hypothetical protein WD011_01375 [Nitriliruptoraceae bacterium]